MPVPGIILASSSPRRQALIGELGVPVELCPADVPEEPLPGEQPDETAVRLALTKAKATAHRKCGGVGVVVAADTVVADQSRIFGKPSDPVEARSMLGQLRGREHRVITGLALVDLTTGRTDVRRVTTRVRLRDYSDREIEEYARSGKPLDKAGSYGIQDAELDPVREIDGCYLNVVGLPLCAVVESLRSLGHTLPEKAYAYHRGKGQSIPRIQSPGPTIRPGQRPQLCPLCRRHPKQTTR